MKSRNEIIGEIANKFLACPLPDTVKADLCAVEQNYQGRTGTNLLSFTEAKKMLVEILQGYEFREEKTDAMAIKEENTELKRQLDRALRAGGFCKEHTPSGGTRSCLVCSCKKMQNSIHHICREIEGHPHISSYSESFDDESVIKKTQELRAERDKYLKALEEIRDLSKDLPEPTEECDVAIVAIGWDEHTDEERLNLLSEGYSIEPHSHDENKWTVYHVSSGNFHHGKTPREAIDRALTSIKSKKK